jgi:hypothetical protein
LSIELGWRQPSSDDGHGRDIEIPTLWIFNALDETPGRSQGGERTNKICNATLNDLKGSARCEFVVCFIKIKKHKPL